MTIRLSSLPLSPTARSALLEIATTPGALPYSHRWTVGSLLEALRNRLDHVYWPSYGDRRVQSLRAVDLREGIWALTAAALVAAGEFDSEARAVFAERCGDRVLVTCVSGSGAETVDQLHAWLKQYVAERKLVVKAGPSADGFAAEREILAAEELLGAVEWLAVRRAGEVVAGEVRTEVTTTRAKSRQWTGPRESDLRQDGVTLRHPVPPERFPFCLPEEHDQGCGLRGGGLFCDCGASAADDDGVVR